LAAGRRSGGGPALALAAYAGLRLGEVRALAWSNIDVKTNMITVHRSLLPDGTAKDPKTDAGKRTIPMLPALRRELLAWKIKAPHKRPHDLIIGTAAGKPVEERNLRRAFDGAKDATKIDVGETRLSWHALRHSATPMPESRCASTRVRTGTPPRSYATCSTVRPPPGSASDRRLSCGPAAPERSLSGRCSGYVLVLEPGFERVPI
jgi:integrase